MSEMNDGGPAFPISHFGVHGPTGMSLRDWFAGGVFHAAMGTAHGLGDMDAGMRHDLLGQVAALSYEAADAMLAARAAKKGAE
jgi:hypothetical protein